MSTERRSGNDWPSSRGVELSLSACAVSVLLTSCGGSSAAGTAPPTTLSAPVITAQPADLSVPMGLSASFSVTAQGASLRYQWFVNGVLIGAANSSTYVTPPTAFTDSGGTFTVTVSNAGGSVTSAPATLTVTARAPNPQDLRFQLVDAPATVNGWGGPDTGIFAPSFFSPSEGLTYSGALGTPLAVDNSGPGSNFFAWQAAVPGQSGLYYDLDVGYVCSLYPNFPADVLPGSTAWNDNGMNPASAGSVVNALNLQPTPYPPEWPQGTYCISWIQAPQQTGFEQTVATVATSDLQAAVQQQAAMGAVVTAISGNNGQITYLSYGWQADPTTVYETQVATVSFADTPAAAASLAQQGYIITASGMVDATTAVLVGTRVAGDTMPRPFLDSATSSLQTIEQHGYAVVVLMDNITTNSLNFEFLAER